jgi:broad specificity phosphatase PhoE
VPLDRTGRRQAASLAAALMAIPLGAVYSSPQVRALETAREIGRARGIRPRLEPAVQEVDFGEWTGARFDRLEIDPRWRRFNERRASASIPGGEPLARVQRRMIAAVKRLCARHGETPVVLVTHAEPIRLTLLAVLDLGLDDYSAIAIAPASISIVAITRGRLVAPVVNDVAGRATCLEIGTLVDGRRNDRGNRRFGPNTAVTP